MADDRTPPEPATDDPGTGPTVLSRQELRSQAKAGRGTSGRRWWYVLGGVGAVLVAAIVVLATTTGSPTNAARPPATTASPAATVTGPPCPLTGAPTPTGGPVPAVPALAVKVGNYPDERPSAGLDHADVVFEEPVEGSITRLVAVFQCQAPALVGDIRSAREPDVAILSQLSHPLFVHAGGIDPILAMLAAAPITNLNYGGRYSSAMLQQPGRVAPYSTFVNVSTLRSLDHTDTTPPAPIFQYSATPPAGAVAGSGASVHIPFSSYSDVTWTWSPAGHDYLRAYSGQPDRLIGGSQTAATNVVVMTVQTFTGPWAENSFGAREVEVTATGTGPVVVMRDGMAIAGTWSRSSLTQPATFATSAGTPITLRPGNTWVELVPAGVTVTPSAA